MFCGSSNVRSSRCAVTAVGCSASQKRHGGFPSRGEVIGEGRRLICTLCVVVTQRHRLRSSASLYLLMDVIIHLLFANNKKPL